jgi:hypothetical protein
VIRKKGFITASGVVIVLAGVITYLFLWGKLFPYSPVIVGFTKHETANTVVYVQKGTPFDRYAELDSCVPTVENFHELKFRKKPRIFIFRDRESYLGHCISKARFSAYSGNSLLISSWALKEAEEGKISLTIYVTHELSHVLLFQYKGLLGEFRYPNWLLEGIAVYGSNQMGTSFYPGREETLREIGRGNFLPPKYFHTGKEEGVRLDVRYRIAFIYSEFACIVDYLVGTYGKEKFMEYMKALLKSGDQDAVFRKVYGISFDNMIENFKIFCSQNR